MLKIIENKPKVIFDKKNYPLLILLLIISFALFLRIYQLGQIPNGLFCDEAATGYDAFSLLKTGKDSHGNFLPILINRHNTDNAEAMYTYLTIPSVLLFNLTIFSTRLLSAIIGTLTILTTYLLTKELFNKKIGLISAFLLAVSPWHLQFSRIAFRAILTPFFITLGLFFLLKGLNKPKFFIAAALTLGLSLYTYHVIKLFLPLMIILFFLFYHKKIITSLKNNMEIIKIAILSSILFLILAFPIYYLSFFGGGNIRLNEVSVFNAQSPLLEFLWSFSEHLSPDFLFINGDANLRHSIPHFGQLLLILLPFILLALGFFIYKRKKRGFLLISLFISGVIPASLTIEGIPHAVRSISAVPFLIIIAAFGIYLFYQYLNKNKKKHIKVIALAIAFILIAVNALFFIHAYFIEYPSSSEDSFQFGFKEIIEYTEEHSNNYDNIILTNKTLQSYIFPLFFAKLDPVQFQKSRDMGKYMVCKENITECYKYEGHNLFIVKPDELPDTIIKHYVNNTKNQIAFKIVE
jgi:4-amino-4-deoxy-L-arabinose transferase-like glycosyltransferase